MELTGQKWANIKHCSSIFGKTLISLRRLPFGTNVMLNLSINKRRNFCMISFCMLFRLQDNVDNDVIGECEFSVLSWFSDSSISLGLKKCVNPLGIIQTLNRYDWRKWRIIIREFKHATFLSCGNRKWAVFPFNSSCHCHLYIAKYLSSIRDDEAKNLADTTAQAREMFISSYHPRHKNVTCLNSLLSPCTSDIHP